MLRGEAATANRGETGIGNPRKTAVAGVMRLVMWTVMQTTGRQRGGARTRPRGWLFKLVVAAIQHTQHWQGAWRTSTLVCASLRILLASQAQERQGHRTAARGVGGQAYSCR